MKIVRKIEDIAHKMRLVGDNVDILNESALIQTPKNSGITSLYRLENNRLVLGCKYSEINKVNNSEICITKSTTGKYGLIDFKGNPIIEPGYMDIDDRHEGILIATLGNGLKSILNYKGNELVPYTMSSVKIVDTILGYIIDSKTHNINSNLMLIKYEGGKATLEKLEKLNKEIAHRSYIIKYDRIIILDKNKENLEISLTSECSK